AADRNRLAVRDLKVFGRLDGDQPGGAIDLSRVLESSLRMAWSEVSQRARVLRSYGEVPPVRGSESGLGQVFLNLLVNAAQAIVVAGGDDHEVAVATRCEGNRVVAEVRDTGLGVSAEL